MAGQSLASTRDARDVHRADKLEYLGFGDCEEKAQARSAARLQATVFEVSITRLEDFVPVGSNVVELRRAYAAEEDRLKRARQSSQDKRWTKSLRRPRCSRGANQDDRAGRGFHRCLTSESVYSGSSSPHRSAIRDRIVAGQPLRSSSRLAKNSAKVENLLRSLLWESFDHFT